MAELDDIKCKLELEAVKSESLIRKCQSLEREITE